LSNKKLERKRKKKGEKGGGGERQIQRTGGESSGHEVSLVTTLI